jgi:hypothetical protein
MINHKRFPVDRVRHSAPPPCSCFACRDTGIVLNGDGLANRFVPDYDRDDSGRSIPGLDAALICQCQAAYASTGPEGEPCGGGYRDSAGVRRIDTGAGWRMVGADMPMDAVRELHRIRREQWQEAQRRPVSVEVIAEAKKLLAGERIGQELPAASWGES